MAFPLVAGTVGQPTDVHAGMVVKRVRVATIANGTLATAFANGQTVDGIVLATGDRILLKDQTTGADNGVYTANASGAPTRAIDFDESAEVLPNTLIVVAEGTVNADTVWQLTTNASITLGTTALVFGQLSAVKGNAQGDLIYFDGTNWQRLAKGTASQVLAMNGGATAPEWVAAGVVTFKGCRVTHSATQTVGTASATLIAFNTEVFDTNAFHDNVTNNTRLTIPTTGYYTVKASLYYTEVTVGGDQRKLMFFVNGVQVYEEMGGMAVTASDLNGLSASCTLLLTAADYVEVKMYQDSGSTVTVATDSATARQPQFEALFQGS